MSEQHATTSKLAMQLSHGRLDPQQEMEGGGIDGPSIIVDRVQWTYGRILFIDFAQSENVKSGEIEYTKQSSLSVHVDDLCLADGLFFYDGIYYSDFSILPIVDSIDVRCAEYFEASKAIKQRKSV